MVTESKKSISRQAAIWACLGMSCLGWVRADEYYSGGMTVDIDRDVTGYLWIADATVNMYENAWIKNVYNSIGQIVSPGDVWAESGAVLNIYGGKIDSVLYVTTSYNSFPDADVTVFGTDFAIDGVPVAPGTAEVFLEDNVLSGVYESGTPFAFHVGCFSEGDFYLTVKLGWQASSPDIEVSPEAIEFGEVEVGTQQSATVTIANNGTGNLSLQSLAIEQVGGAEFGYVPLAQLPVTVEPGNAVNVEVTFTPSVEGPYEALFQVYSDDPETPYAEVLLTGNGVVTELSIAEKIDAIAIFYEEGLVAGSLAGTGPGISGAARAAVVEKTLGLAYDLIYSGCEDLAIYPLEWVAAKTSGAGWPRDFVAGDSVAQLNAMVQDLLDDLNELYPE